MREPPRRPPKFDHGYGSIPPHDLSHKICGFLMHRFRKRARLIVNMDTRDRERWEKMNVAWSWEEIGL